MLNIEELQKVRELLIHKGGLAVEDILRDDELLQQLGIDKANITPKDMENVLSGFDWELEYLKKRLHNIEYLLDITTEEVKKGKRNNNIKIVLALSSYLLGLISSIYGIKNKDLIILTPGFMSMGFVVGQSQINNHKYLVSSSKEQKKYQKLRDELDREVQRRMN